MPLKIHQRIESAIAPKVPWLSTKLILPLLVFLLIGLPSLTALAFSYGPMLSVQPEAGTLSGGATTVADAAASGGQSVKFSAPGTCPNALHEPGGDDGMGGCWPYAGNTGIPSGTVLSAYAGPCTVTADNAVINAKTVNCDPLLIKAENVTVTNSQVNGPIMVDSDDCGLGYSFNVTDSRIHVNDINFRGLIYCNYVATRVEVTGGQSMAWCDTCTIQDSYLHSPLEDPAGAAANHAAHNSTVRMSKFAIIKHNTLHCEVVSYPQPDGLDTSGCSANQTGYSHDGSAPHDSTVEANLYMPTTGGFCAYGGSTTGDLASVHHIVFKDNIFKRGTDLSDHGEFVCGYYGVVSGFDSGRPGNQWINNKFDDGTIVTP